MLSADMFDLRKILSSQTKAFPLHIYTKKYIIAFFWNNSPLTVNNHKKINPQHFTKNKQQTNFHYS